MEAYFIIKYENGQCHAYRECICDICHPASCKDIKLTYNGVVSQTNSECTNHYTTKLYYLCERFEFSSMMLWYIP